MASNRLFTSDKEASLTKIICAVLPFSLINPKSSVSKPCKERFIIGAWTLPQPLQTTSVLFSSPCKTTFEHEPQPRSIEETKLKAAWRDSTVCKLFGTKTHWWIGAASWKASQPALNGQFPVTIVIFSSFVCADIIGNSCAKLSWKFLPTVTALVSYRN